MHCIVAQIFYDFFGLKSIYSISRNDPKMMKEAEEYRTDLDDFEEELENLPVKLIELQQNFKKLIKKLDSIQPLWSTSLKKDALLCIIHINYKIIRSYEDDYFDGLWKWLSSPLHVASKGGFHKLVKFIMKNTGTI